MDKISFLVGSSHFLAIKTDGSLWTWGGNTWGTVGDGTTDYKEDPVKLFDNVKMPDVLLKSQSAPSTEIRVFVNGTELAFDQPPIIENSRVLVPFRVIFEALGADVDWEQSSQTVTAERGDVTVTLKIGSDTIVKNGEQIKLDVPAKIIGNRTMVPARAIAESFGASVEWDGKTKTVIIADTSQNN
jgi:hypothetical protein